MISNKNKIKQYILFSGVILLNIIVFVSCDDFLTLKPDNRISSTAFFKNESQMNQSVIGAYSHLQGMTNQQYRFTEVRSDNTINQFSDENRGPHPYWYIDEFVMTPSNIALEQYWPVIWQGIQKCNTILNHIEDVEFDDQNLKNQYTGEAKFLRAYYYFDLVRLFGSVPLVLEQVESPDDAFKTIEKRASIEELYQQILTDVTDAVELLPEEYSSANKGRATKGAAMTMLADIYLTSHNYSDAVNELNKVMNLGYSLLPNYGDVFNPNNKNNQEIIFSVNYAELEEARNLGNSLIYAFSPRNSGTDIVGDNAQSPTGLNLPTHDIYYYYEKGDERRDVSIGYYINPSNRIYGFGHVLGDSDTLLYVKKYDYPHTVQGVTNVNWPIYRYAHILLMKAEAINEIEDGSTNEAYDLINQVRQRAGLDPLTPNLSKSQFRDAVYREERVELAFENHRWFNLLRTGRALETMKAHAESVKDIQPHLKEPVYVIEEYKLLYPIPQRELSLNPDLGQNPGW